MDLVEEYEDNVKNLNEGPTEKELKKSYRTKINFQDQDELLLEIEKSKSSNKYYVTVSDLKLKYDIEDVKSFNNFEEAKNLFQNLKEKYDGKNIRFLLPNIEDIVYWASIAGVWIIVICLTISLLR